MVCQFVLLPVLGFLIVYVVQFKHAARITLLTITYQFLFELLSLSMYLWQILLCRTPLLVFRNRFFHFRQIVLLLITELGLGGAMTPFSTIFFIIMLPVNLLVYSRITYRGDVVWNLNWEVTTSLVLVILSCRILYGSLDHNVPPKFDGLKMWIRTLAVPT